MEDRTYAIIVTVQQYNHEDDFSTVPYARKDGEDFENALIKFGVPKENIIRLVDRFATKASIKAELKRMSVMLLEGERGIFYFAGHGAYLNKNNFIVPSDGHKLMTEGTCVSIDYILGMLTRSKCETNLLFFDCCHSGFIPGEKNTREIDIKFEPDELKRKYRNEKYCIGFASCSSHETSISSPELHNGVWTHFLVKALTGNGSPEIYEYGILFSDNLQAYLRDRVSEYTKINSEKRINQTPMIFGSQTDRFIIADVNSIWESREYEVRAKTGSIDASKVSMKSFENGKIKFMVGFKSGHRVPDRINKSTNGFVRSIGTTLIKPEFEEFCNTIQTNFKYRRKEVNVDSDIGTEYIVTPDFTFSMDIYQHPEWPDYYIIEREIREFTNSEIILSEAFNKTFSELFDRLVFSVSNEIDIEKLIDNIEDLPRSSAIDVAYNSADLSNCKIIIDDLDFEILVEKKQISIVSNYKVQPIQLVEALKNVQEEIGMARIFTLE